MERNIPAPRTFTQHFKSGICKMFTPRFLSLSALYFPFHSFFSSPSFFPFFLSLSFFPSNNPKRILLLATIFLTHFLSRPLSVKGSPVFWSRNLKEEENSNNKVILSLSFFLFSFFFLDSSSLPLIFCISSLFL